MKFVDYLLLFFYVGVLMFITSCTKEELMIDYQEPQLLIDTRLPSDSNGYYHMELSEESLQTIHRIDGKIKNITEPTQVTFTTNMSWVYPPTGEYVPMINPTSWATPNDPLISTVIAPIRSVKNDTLIITIDVNEWDISKQVSIVLE